MTSHSSLSVLPNGRSSEQTPSLSGSSSSGFFSCALSASDKEIAAAIAAERTRQARQIELIASENFASKAVLEAQGSVLTNKYAEGYPGRRYYGGCGCVDIAESLAIERVKRLFGCGFANVQPHSGAQANEAVFFALLKPGDTILGMSLSAGGHLTHGARPNISGRWFDALSYGVRQQDARIDFDEVERLAMSRRPKLIIAGGSAYPRTIDFARFRAIADAAGAVFMVDMAHFAGLVAGGVHPNPFPHAHVVTSTTHKTLRGPRGGFILCDDAEMARRIDSAVFPGVQGGPLMHVIAAKAVAFGEALEPAFRDYAKAVAENASVLARTLAEAGLEIVSGGTDTHLLLVDLRPLKLTGRDAEKSLERAGIACNKNGIPFDPEKPTVTSGIRLGSAAMTTRGFGAGEFVAVGRIIVDVLRALSRAPQEIGAAESRARAEVEALLARFPFYE